MHESYRGCWPTMITPFTEKGSIDFRAVATLVDWYIAHGAAGIFAVCQSSEMFFLSEQEKLDIAKAVVDANAGRVKIIASGHTSDDHLEQIQQLGDMAKTGVDAVVLVANRMAAQGEDDVIFQRNALDIFRQLPETVFGLYECPYPYLRLLTDAFLSDCARSGKLVFLKDVSCSRSIQKRRAGLVKGTRLSLFNANTSTLLESWRDGYDGYNGVMANFHIDIYRWLFEHFRDNSERAERVSDFLSLAAVTEARAYPVNAKYHFARTGVPMSRVTRSVDMSVLNENARHEIDSLIRIERFVRHELGLGEE